jgi:hypothetical protein
MADRIIKGDSGNDVIIQNNDASRKIEVTNSGDVEVTGDVKTTTVKATNLKANDGTAGLSIADSTGRVTANEKISVDDIIEKTSAHGVEIDGVLLKDGALESGSVGDSITFSNKYWCQIKFSAGVDVDNQIAFDSSTSPYALFQTGSDTTNFIQGTAINDLKIVKAGIYLVIFTLSANLVNDGERNLYVEIRGTGSNSTTVLAGAKSQIANPEGATTSGTGTAVLCKAFSANDQINFHSSSAATGNAVIDPDYSSISIALIRPT